MGTGYLKSRIHSFASLLSVNVELLDSEELANEEQLVKHIIAVFQGAPKVFRSFLLRIFDLRIRAVLERKNYQSNFGEDQSINEIVPDCELSAVLRELEAETGLVFPRPVLSTVSFYVQIVLLIGPAILIIAAFLFNIESMIPIYGVIGVPPLLVLIVIPYLTAYFFFPRFFQSTKFVKLTTYGDLLRDLVWINQVYFVQEDFALTRKEPEKLLDTLDD